MFAYTDAPFAFHTVLAFSVLFGVLAGGLYELFRFLRCALRCTLPRRSTAVWMGKCLLFAADMLYFILLSVFAVLFLFAFNRGQLRLSMLIAMSVGFWLYYVSIGRILSSLYEKILGFLRILLMWIHRHTLYYVWLFVRYIGRKTVGKLLVLLKKVWDRIVFGWSICHAEKRLKMLSAAAENGFVSMNDHISIN